jgi:hypothetical protein
VITEPDLAALQGQPARTHVHGELAASTGNRRPHFLHGPLLYDLASAAMYVGGLDQAEDLIEAYLRRGPLARAETSHGLAAMLRSGGRCRRTTSRGGSRRTT